MLIAQFLSRHWLDLVLGLAAFFLLTWKFLPPTMAGLDRTFVDNAGNEQPQKRQSILDAIMTLLVFSLTRSLIVTIGLKGATTLIMFAVIVVELINRHTISTNAVILSIVGIIALHFENIIEQAEEVSIWKIFTYKRRK